MKIVWAVDPLDIEIPLTPMYAFLKALSPKGTEIETVYVASHQQRIRELSDPTFAEAALQNALSQSNILAKQSVIWDSTGSQASQVEELLRHAVENNASLVAVFTHGRHGLKRLYQGSFSETVATSSPIPVLLAKPTNRIPKQIERVLFATDFSVTSTKTYAELLRIAAEAEWELVIFHASDPSLSEDLVEPVNAESKRYINRLKNRKKSFENMAANAGVEALVIIDNSFVPVFELVLECADTYRCDLVCSTAKRNLVRHLLLGSVTRQLMRESTRPLLVLKA